MSTDYKVLIKGLKSMPSFKLKGEDYSGPYLAAMLGINWNQAAQEANDTPGLIYELGHLVAVAHLEKERADLLYRVWREGIMWRYSVGPDALDNAKEAGFQSVVDPGVDAKGKEKPAKCPTKSDVETYMRTLDEYREHNERKHYAEMVWQILHAAYEAAKSRQFVLKHWDPETMGHDGFQESESDDADDETFDAAKEQAAMAKPRNPLPPPPETTAPPPAAVKAEPPATAPGLPAPPPPPPAPPGA